MLGFSAMIVAFALVPIHLTIEKFVKSKMASVFGFLILGTLSGFLLVLILTAGGLRYAPIGLLPGLTASIIWICLNIDILKERKTSV